MNNIHEPTDAFSFDSLKLSKPVTAPGGSYFIRFTVNNAPLYIQPPKCKTKQGFLKTGKRYYTDLIFTNTDDDFIRWMENLEITCHKHLFANREKWFEGDMEISEIENYFSSPMKIYKTGKYYIVRVNVQTNLGTPSLTIYDEDNNVISIDAVDDKMDIITILEVKGIKCTSTSFQIEIETKQVLCVKPVELFTKCIIKPTKNSIHPATLNYSGAAPERDMNVRLESMDSNVNQVNTHVLVPNTGTKPDSSIVLTNDIDIHGSVVLDENEIKIKSNSVISEIEESTLDELDDTSPDLVKHPAATFVDINDEPDENISLNRASPSDNENNVNPEEGLVINTDVLPDEHNLELTEFNIDLDTLPDDNITIKKSNDVYYEMYREACRKAKLARDLALSSYLEAKRIKNTYMLDDLSDSDESDLERESNIE